MPLPLTMRTIGGTAAVGMAEAVEGLWNTIVRTLARLPSVQARASAAYLLSELAKTQIEIYEREARR